MSATGTGGGPGGGGPGGERRLPLGQDVILTGTATVVVLAASAGFARVYAGAAWAGPVLTTWDPLESTCRHASLSIL